MSSHAKHSRANAHYTLAVLTLVYVFNFLDRQLLAILLEPIKAEFNASDTAMGLLYGFAFAAFYATLAIPVAMYADKSNRRNIVAVSISLWSFFTVLCGLASSFTQLFAARVGVAVGEAGGVPPSQSMITDLYPPEQRARAMAIYSSGTFIGSLIALIGGAYITQHYGWRTAFIVVGLPGILLAIILRLTTSEPVRGAFDLKTEPSADSQATEPASGITSILRSGFFSTSMILMLAGAAFASLAGYALSFWLPSFFIRVHELSIMESAKLVAIVGISCGLIGSIFGGVLADRLSKKNRAWMLYTPALSLFISLPLMLLFLLWPASATSTLFGYHFPTAVWWFCGASLTGSWWAAATFVAVQESVTPGQRTLACALILFVMNLIGFGLGSFLAGALSDWYQPEYGQLALRYSLITMMSAYVFAGLCYLLAGKTFEPAKPT